MTEEQRKPGRPPKDKFVQAIEATIGESKPSAALLVQTSFRAENRWQEIRRSRCQKP